MSQTECVARFTSHGREFMVLHKASAAYLRADGRMIASLGEGLDVDEAIAQAHFQAELFQINERVQEAALLHRLYEMPRTDDIQAIAADYVLIKLPAGQHTQTGDAVYAPFNHNGYAYTLQGWVFLGCFESAQQLEAHIASEQVKDALAPTQCKPASKRFKNLKEGLQKETKVMGYVAIGLAIAFALAYGVRSVLSSWPIVIALLMGAIFVGCAVALWKSKAAKKK